MSKFNKIFILAVFVLIAGFVVLGFANPSKAQTNTSAFYIKTGWNLLSMPLEPNTPKIKDMFAPIIDSVLSIQTFNGGAKTYEKGLEKFNTLTELHVGDGFWLKSSQDSKVEILGTYPTDTAITLKNGWNLFGPVGLNNNTLNDFLITKVISKDQLDRVVELYTLKEQGTVDQKSGLIYYPSDFSTLAHGQGYWVKLAEASTCPMTERYDVTSDSKVTQADLDTCNVCWNKSAKDCLKCNFKETGECLIDIADIQTLANNLDSPTTISGSAILQARSGYTTVGDLNVFKQGTVDPLFTQKVTIKNNSFITTVNLESGVYDFGLKVVPHISRIITNIAVTKGQTVTLTFPKLLIGDVSAGYDDAITFSGDVLVISALAGKTEATFTSNSAFPGVFNDYDLNLDGIINEQDSYFMSNNLNVKGDMLSVFEKSSKRAIMLSGDISSDTPVKSVTVEILQPDTTNQVFLQQYIYPNNASTCTQCLQHVEYGVFLDSGVYDIKITNDYPSSSSMPFILKKAQLNNKEDKDLGTAVLSVSSPDLIIKSIAFVPEKSAYLKNDLISFAVTFKNIGNYETGLFRGQYYVNDQEFSGTGTMPIESLKPGEEKTVQTQPYTFYQEWDGKYWAKIGDNQFKVIVDDQNNIKESNETNNTLTKNFSLKNEGLPLKLYLPTSKYVINETYTIEWTAGEDILQDKLNFSLYRNGVYMATIVSNVSAINKKYIWTVQTNLTAGDNYTIRIWDTKSPSVFIESFKFPVLNPEILTVLSPNGGEKWETGKTYNVSWKIDNFNNSKEVYADVYVRSSKVDQVNQKLVSYHIYFAEEDYPITVPASWGIGDDYKIEIIERNADGKEGVRDSSDNYFSIVSSANQSPVITGTSGPTSIKINETGTWSVEANDPDGTQLNYNVDWGDASAKAETKTTAPSVKTTQKATFTHSYSQAGTYTIILTVTDDKGASAKSTLSVKVSAPTNTLKIIAPNEGDVYVIDEYMIIKWNTSMCATLSCPVDIRIYKSKDNSLVELVGTGVTRQGSGPYSYEVKIFSHLYTLGEKYYISINDTNNKSNVVKSGAFSVEQSPTIINISGPTSLKINETGTWVIEASDPNDASLNYYIDWGDIMDIMSTSSLEGQTSLKVTVKHSYPQAGTYTITFMVINDKKAVAISTKSVKVSADNVLAEVSLNYDSSTPASSNIAAGSLKTSLVNYIIAVNNGVFNLPTITLDLDTAKSSVSDINKVYIYESGVLRGSGVFNSAGRVSIDLPLILPNGTTQIWQIKADISPNAVAGHKISLGMSNLKFPTQPEFSFTKMPFGWSNPMTVVNANQPPVITGTSGPSSIQINETGTWSVEANDPDGTQLNYNIDWGDASAKGQKSTTAPSIKTTQKATFTHSYSQAGTYTITFTVTDDKGASAKSTMLVKVPEESGETPQITSISPTSGPVGTTLTVNGDNLLKYSLNAISFGSKKFDLIIYTRGSPYTYTFISDEQLLISVPDGAETGKVILEFYTSSGYYNTVGSNFTVIKQADLPIKDPIITEIKTKAQLLHNDKYDELRAEIKELRNIVKEQNTKIKYLTKLIAGSQNLTAKIEDRLNNFITYGVDENTQKLGAGERAAVMYSYKNAFNKLPQTDIELEDAIKIANGRWPSEKNANVETKAKQVFKKIYLREADMNLSADNAAITVMSYGLRQKAENRNLNSEKAGINIFKSIYGHLPQTTEDWNILQAITYSGAKR